MKKESVIAENIKVKLKDIFKKNDFKITKQNILLILSMYQEEIGDSIKETGSFKIENIGVFNKIKRKSYDTELPSEDNVTKKKTVTVPEYNTVYFQTDIKLKRKINS